MEKQPKKMIGLTRFIEEMNQEANKELKPSIFMNQELIKFEDEGCLRVVSSRQQEKIPREEIVWLLCMYKKMR